MVTCCIPGCMEKHRKGGSLMFHSFPKNEIQRRKWIQNIRRENFVPNSSSRVCSKHFDEECYETSVCGVARLRRCAVPSLVIFPDDMTTLTHEVKTPQNEGSLFQESETVNQFPYVTSGFQEVILPISHSDYDDSVPCIEEVMCDPLAVDPLSEDMSTPALKHFTSHVKTEVEENVHWDSVVQLCDPLAVGLLSEDMSTPVLKHFTSPVKTEVEENVHWDSVVQTSNVPDVYEQLDLQQSNQDGVRIDYNFNRKNQLSIGRKSRRQMKSKENNCSLCTNQLHEDIGLVLACFSCNALFDCKTSLKQHCRCKGIVQSCAQCTSAKENSKDSKRNNCDKQRSPKVSITVHECPECRERLSSLRKYLAHVKTHIMASRQCSSCRELCNQTDALETTVCYHRLRTFNITDYQTSKKSRQAQNMKHLSCSTCEEIFPNARALKRHCECLGKELCVICVPHVQPCLKEQTLYAKTKTQMNGYVSCQVCRMYFPRRSYLVSHMKKHGKDYRCEVCGRKFLQGKVLNRHLLESKCHLKGKIAQRKEKTFCNRMLKCGLCSFITNTKDSVIRHLSIHTNEYSHICFLCGKSFDKEWSLFRHEISHIGLRPYKCSICTATFSDGANRKAHEKLHSKVKRRHMCSLCDLQFIGRSALRKHQSNHITIENIP